MAVQSPHTRHAKLLDHIDALAGHHARTRAHHHDLAERHRATLPPVDTGTGPADDGTVEATTTEGNDHGPG